MAMANFLFVYTGGAGMAQTDEERAASIQEWTTWFDSLGENVLDAGNPFTGEAKSVANGGEVSDGPVGTLATGYSVIKADSLAAAVEAAKSCPQVKGGEVTVYETFNII